MASKAYVLIQVVERDRFKQHVVEKLGVDYTTVEDARDAASAAFDLLSLNREMQSEEDTDWNEFDEEDEAAMTMRRM